MAFRRASFASLAALRSSASMWVLVESSLNSGALHAGQRLAKPGLSGFSSNSSPHTMQVLIGNAIAPPSYDGRAMSVQMSRAEGGGLFVSRFGCILPEREEALTKS